MFITHSAKLIAAVIVPSGWPNWWNQGRKFEPGIHMKSGCCRIFLLPGGERDDAQHGPSHPGSED
jgi:hypothetical protein